MSLAKEVTDGPDTEIRFAQSRLASMRARIELDTRTAGRMIALQADRSVRQVPPWGALRRFNCRRAAEVGQEFQHRSRRERPCREKRYRARTGQSKQEDGVRR